MLGSFSQRQFFPTKSEEGCLFKQCYDPAQCQTGKFHHTLGPCTLPLLPTRCFPVSVDDVFQEMCAQGASLPRMALHSACS